jgi:hypothetical protein
VSFSDIFWPTFWATAGGVVLAIPTGLYVDRLARSVEKHARRKETCDALDELLRALRAALDSLGRIPGDVDVSAPGRVPLIIWRPQQAVWDLLSPVVREGVGDSRLKVRLGRCFELLQGVAVVLDMLHQFEAAALGPDPYAVRARATADDLKTILKDRAQQVATLIEEVCSETDTYLAAHRSGSGVAAFLRRRG